MSSPASSPMLSVPEKKTADLDRSDQRSNFIAGIRDARAALSVPDSQSQRPSARRANLLRYHRCLASAADDPYACVDDGLAFTWHDAFRPYLRRTTASLRFETAAVVFNVGAASSRIAAAVNRAAEGGVQAACGEFQRAAGAFRAAGEMMEGEDATMDMAPEAVAALERLMLAQAQECCFERALAARSSPTVCSKVARQAALYYEETYVALDTPPLKGHFERSWVSHVKLKAAILNAEACYRYGIELHEKIEIGEEIARLRFGIDALVNAKKATWGAPRSLYDDASRLERDINKSLEKTVEENNRVYLMQIPKLMDPLPAASLVRSISMSKISATLLDAKTETISQSSIETSSSSQSS